MVIISNGFNKFQLAVAAEELFARSKLSLLLTGAYPTKKARRILNQWPLRRSRKVRRLLARGQKIDDRLVVPLWFPESMHALGQVLYGRSDFRNLVSFLNHVSMKEYGREATRHVLEAAEKGARIYHYRAGFGHRSVQAARSAGLVTIGHHSIAHPANVYHSGEKEPPAVG